MSVAAGHLIVANAQRAGDSRHGVSPAPSVIITEDLFRDALVRERKRADRFEEAFVLVLISLNDRDVLSRWKHVVKAVSRTTLDADLIGWFEQFSVLGLIRSVTGSDPEETASALAETITRPSAPASALMMRRE